MQNLGGPLSRFQNPCKNEGHAISILLFWVQKNSHEVESLFRLENFSVFFWCALLGSEATVFYVAALKPVAAAEKESYEKVGGEEEISS